MKTIGPKVFLMLILVASPRQVSTHAFWEQGGTSRLASFAGDIMDSKCATTGSHDPMMKKLGTKDARDCTLKCAKDASFVLYDAGTKTVYQLSDQQKPAPFAGQKVKISGMYDRWTQTIQIESIEAAP